MSDPINFPHAIAGIPIASEGRVREALNRAADTIIDLAELPDEGARDAINLVVNAALYWLFTDETAELDDVVKSSYEGATYDEVLDWCARAPTYAQLLERCGEEYTEAFDYRWRELTGFHLAGKP